MRRIIVGHGPAVVGLAITAILSGFAEAGILAAVAQVGSALVYHGKTVHLELGPLSLSPGVGPTLIFAGALAVLRIALLAYNSHLQARLAADVQMTLRAELFDSFTRAPWDLQSKEREGHLQEMLTGQVIQATTGTLQFAAMVSSLITFAVLVLSAMLLDFVVAIAVVVVALALFGLLRPLSSFGRQSARQLSRSQLEFAGGVGEAVRLAEETHVFGVDDAQRLRIDALVDHAGRLFFQTQFVTRIVPNLFQSLVYLTVIAGLALLYATHAGNVASLGAVILIMVRAGSYGQQVQSSYQAILQSLPFAEGLHHEVTRYSAARVAEPPGRLERIEALSMDRVAYAYREGEAVLTDISFEAHRGEAVGIVGPSGAGKSTLVQIMLRLREPQDGEYAINGVPASTLSFADWHRRVAYVPQKPQLLHASVADNIRFFRDIDEADVVRAAELARIDTDIRGWRNGYETTIGPRADSISGGQQQRICLARALASRPDVLVLDEPTSALDPRSEILIQQSLATIAEDLTLFVVTHRMGLLGVCDRLLVIVEGRVDDFGSTDEVRTANAYLAAI